MKTAIVLASLLALSAPSCSGLPGYQPPTLDQVVARVDIARAIECAGKGTAKEKARCLGVSLMSDALNLALDEAAKAGRAAIEAASGAGADDLSDDDRSQIAADCDLALDKLATEIANTRAVSAGYEG